MDTWKIVLIVIAVVTVCALVGVLWLRHYLREKERARVAAMGPEELELYQATKEHALKVLEAKKKLKSLTKDWDKTVRKAEKSLQEARAMGTKKLGSWGPLHLWESRIETKEGTAYFSSGAVTATVAPATENGQQQAEQWSLVRIEAPHFTSVVACQAKDVPKAGKFAQKVNEASNSWAASDQQARQAVAAATEQLVKAHSGRLEAVIRAQYELEDVRRDTARIDAAKAAVLSAVSAAAAVPEPAQLVAAAPEPAPLVAPPSETSETSEVVGAESEKSEAAPEVTG